MVGGHARSVGGALLRVAVPKAVAGALLIVANVAVARTLGPASYGAFALAFTCVLVLDAIAGPSLDLLALREAAKHPLAEVTPVERALLRVKVIVAAAGIFTAIIAGTLAGWWFGLAAPDALLPFAAACSGAALLILRSAQVRLQLDHRLSRYGASELLQAGGRALLMSLALAIGVRSPAWLLAAGALSAAAAASVAWRDVWRAITHSTPPDRTLVGAAAFTALTCAIGTLASKLDLFVLRAVAPAAEVGLYSAALIAATMVELAGAYVAPALASRLTPLSRDGQLHSFVIKVQATAWIALVAIVSAALWILPGLYTAVLPPEYAASARLALVLLPAGLSGLIVFPVALNVILMRAPQQFLWMDGLSLVWLVPAWAWAAREHGALGVAWVTSTWRIAKAVIVTIAAVRLASQSPAPVFSSVFAPSLTGPR
jgi:O-antigen/teichoic acid export membrane protein